MIEATLPLQPAVPFPVTIVVRGAPQLEVGAKLEHHTWRRWVSVLNNT
jgi:hypothetical protein